MEHQDMWINMAVGKKEKYLNLLKYKFGINGGHSRSS